MVQNCRCVVGLTDEQQAIGAEKFFGHPHDQVGFTRPSSSNHHCSFALLIGVGLNITQDRLEQFKLSLINCLEIKVILKGGINSATTEGIDCVL